jgi:hypothetical protein
MGRGLVSQMLKDNRQVLSFGESVCDTQGPTEQARYDTGLDPYLTLMSKPYCCWRSRRSSNFRYRP